MELINQSIILILCTIHFLFINELFASNNLISLYFVLWKVYCLNVVIQCHLKIFYFLVMKIFFHMYHVKELCYWWPLSKHNLFLTIIYALGMFLIENISKTFKFFVPFQK